MNIPYNNYKTQSCKFFDKDGQCKFGKNCSFAHGGHELRNPYDNLPAGSSLLPNPAPMPGAPFMMPGQPDFFQGGFMPNQGMNGMDQAMSQY